jgi:peptidoglycan/LPS O-acetylase OafA/YrhL
MEGAKSIHRISQLDALRAFAIGIVLIHHYRDTRFFLSGFGATLFFVLSGFFATKTLLKLKAGMETGRTKAGPALKVFYFKRWMRLWPLYYLVLALTLFLNVENARSSFLWNAAFLSNLNVLISGNWSGRFSPLWSLSVLEQFYLVWPAFILACPKKYLLPSILAVVAVAPLYRLGCYLTDASPLYWCVMPFTTFDQLGCGALLALCVENVVSQRTAGVILGISGKLFAPLFLLLLACKCCNFEPPFCAIYIGTIASVAFLWLAGKAASGIPGRAGRLMENRLLCHVGTLSYSIFLLHNFTELLVPKTAFLRPIMESNFKPVILIPLTVLLAHLAWRFIEAPMLSLRKKIIPAPAIPVAALSLPAMTTD